LISSANNTQKTPSIYNVDYDFCDWSVYRLKQKEKIVNELCTLLQSGQKTIGINSHHCRFSLKDGDYAFFDKIFSIMDESKKVHWINPFI